MSRDESFIKAVREELGGEIAEKVSDISYRSCCYILYVASISDKKEKDLQAEFADYHVRFPDRSYETFIKFMKSWHKDKYKYTIEAMGYFIDEAVAFDYAKKNIGDINEAGAFPYIIIASMPLNVVYPFANTRTFRALKFNEGTQEYEDVNWDDSEKLKYLKELGRCGAY